MMRVLSKAEEKVTRITKPMPANAVQYVPSSLPPLFSKKKKKDLYWFN